MGVLILLISIMLMAMCTAKKTCTNYEALEVNAGKVLPNKMILNITSDGLMSCSRACLMRTICKSFNYNSVNGICQLNSETMTSVSELVDINNYVFSDISNWPVRLAGSCANHSCPLNSYCDPVNDLALSCVTNGCLGLPRLDNGRYDISPDFADLGTSISLICDDSYFAQNDVLCQQNGTWSEGQCAPVSSCSIVKKLQPDSEDGEYWLILPNMDNYRARIYCHGMSSIIQSEYLTLKNVNRGIYPQVMNSYCNKETPLGFSCTGLGGEVWFYKIKIDIETLQVNVVDLTFANVSNERRDYLAYGVAHDCYTFHTDGQLRCGVKGQFTIDLSGTGWRISEEQEWTLYGWMPYMMPVERKRNGTLIYLNCGGYQGGCRAKEGLFLTPFPEDMYFS